MARLGLRTLRKPNTDGFIEEIKNESTQNLLKTTEKPTKETIVEPTENIRKTYEQKKPTNAKPTHTPTHNIRTNLRITTEKPTKIIDLVGIQKITFLKLVNLAKDFGFLDNQGNRITPHINGNEFTKSFENRTYKQTKDILYHLKSRGFIQVYSMKNGRAGNVQYLIEKDLYNSVLIDQSFDKPTHNLLKTTEKPTQEPTYKPTNPDSYSNRIDLINNTITTEATFKIPENLKSIGIGQKNLESILNLKVLSFDEIQESLNHYAYDIENGAKPNLALFFGVLRKGSCYISQKYSIELQAQIESEISRIENAKNLEAEKIKSELYLRFQDYKNNYPEFLEEVRKSQRFNVSENILESIAFQKFCEQNQ